MNALKRFDDGIARGEATLATLFLLAMIVSASFQAIFRNLAGAEIAWANDVLQHLEWIDPFLQKGTLWLAFLGASLATREGRHIGIDLAPRLAPPRAKLLMRSIAAFLSSVVSFFLARAFWSAVLVNANERPATMEVYGDTGSLHICDATAQQIADASLEMPSMFCGARSFLDVLGVPVETPEAALQLIVPVMFVIMSVRLFANGIESARKLAMGEVEDELDHEQAAAAAAAKADAEALAAMAGDSSSRDAASDDDSGSADSDDGSSAEEDPAEDAPPDDPDEADGHDADGDDTDDEDDEEDA